VVHVIDNPSGPSARHAPLFIGDELVAVPEQSEVEYSAKVNVGGVGATGGDPGPTGEAMHWSMM